MNIVTHSKLSSLSSNHRKWCSSYSAIWLDCNHGCSGRNLYVGLIPDPPSRVHTWGSGFTRLAAAEPLPSVSAQTSGHVYWASNTWLVFAE